MSTRAPQRGPYDGRVLAEAAITGNHMRRFGELDAATMDVVWGSADALTVGDVVEAPRDTRNPRARPGRP